MFVGQVIPFSWSCVSTQFRLEIGVFSFPRSFRFESFHDDDDDLPLPRGSGGSGSGEKSWLLQSPALPPGRLPRCSVRFRSGSVKIVASVGGLKKDASIWAEFAVSHGAKIEQKPG